MAAQTELKASFLERIGDGFTSFTEGVMGFVTRLLGGSSSERVTKTLGFYRPKGADAASVVPGSVLAKVNELESKMQALSDDELKQQTTAFRERLKAGEMLDDLLVEAFAACREAARRNKNMRHYDVQIIGG